MGKSLWRTLYVDTLAIHVNLGKARIVFGAPLIL